MEETSCCAWKILSMKVTRLPTSTHLCILFYPHKRYKDSTSSGQKYWSASLPSTVYNLMETMEVPQIPLSCLQFANTCVEEVLCMRPFFKLPNFRTMHT